MKRYLLIVVAFTLGLCLLVSLFNYRVDPYALYHYEQANADRLSRIDQIFHMRITKPWYVSETKPTAVVIGTSRSGAIRPRHPTWPQEGSYNLSLPGATAYEMLRFIEHAQAAGPLDKLMIGLEFEAFIHAQPKIRSGFDEPRMARGTDDLTSLRHNWQLATDVADTLVSLPGLARSVSALAGTWKGGRRYYRDGAWESTSTTLTGSGGYIYVAKGYLLELQTDEPDLDSNLETLAEILRFAHRQKIDTRLFFTPEHVFMVDLWWRLGYGELWNEFHRRVVALNSAVAVEMGAEPLPLYGFNQAAGVVDEPIVTKRNSTRSMFLDGVHFRPQLGTRIMQALWTEGSDFGKRLDVDSVEPYLVEVGQVRRSFHAANTRRAADLRQEISPELR